MEVYCVHDHPAGPLAQLWCVTANLLSQCPVPLTGQHKAAQHKPAQAPCLYQCAQTRPCALGRMSFTMAIKTMPLHLPSVPQAAFIW